MRGNQFWLTLEDQEKFTSDNTELDFDTLIKIREVISRGAAGWDDYTFKILRTYNKDLLDRLRSCETRLESLAFLKVKPKPVMKQLKADLEEYEKVLSMCVLYADRHKK